MSDRQSIYYWKCDRASAFYALQKSQSAYAGTELELPLYKVLSRFLGDDTFVFRPAGGQGNHLTYIVNHQHTDYFVRLENGPERDGYMAVEARILDEVRAIGVPTPAVFYVDASRQQLPFAIQIMTHIRYSDLNSLNKKGSLNVCRIANEIGQAVARWQTLTPNGFGPFHASILREEGKLVGLHATYADYFLLNLTRHLSFLSDHHFLTIDEAKALSTIVEQHKHYLDLDLGCLVHKDLALWNILGTPTTIEAFIDWDDCIVGDPTDDLSLLACFHDREFLTAALEGYEQIRPLPNDFWPRFWLHLLRNMIVKAVIRVGAGYFDRSDDFFLISAGTTGQSLKTMTNERLWLAYRGLQNQATLADL